ILAQGDDVQEHAEEEVATDVVPPTLTSPSPSSPVIPSSPPHQSPSPPQPQAIEGSSHLVQQVLDTCSALVFRVEENVFNQGRISVDMKTDEGIKLVVDQEKNAEVVAASTPIPTAKPKTLKIAAAAPAVSTRRRKRVTREEMEKEDEEIIKSINETPTRKAAKRRKLSEEAQEADDLKKRLEIKAAKRRKLSEEAQEADDLKKRLEIVQDEDDDVFVEAIPLAQKVPIVDYQVVVIDNKPKYKIIRADNTH
nr:hypothetical protein [Tanacetum cinerariifolium]